MSGKFVYLPSDRDKPHSCYTPSSRVAGDGGVRLSSGTVLQCDCGRTWILDHKSSEVGMRWRPEGRWERRRRERLHPLTPEMHEYLVGPSKPMPERHPCDDHAARPRRWGVVL